MGDPKLTAQCIACANFAFSREWGTREDKTAFAKSGFGTCAHKKEPGRAVSATYDRECDKWAAADPETVAKLRAWLAKQQGK